MKVLSLVAATVAGLAANVFAAPLASRATDDTNPFAGKAFYGNPYYRSLVETEVARLKAEGKTDLAAKAAKVAQVPVFSWIYDTSSVTDISGYLKDAAAIQKKTGTKQIVQLVIYNLPDRDCSSKASAGELSLASSGETSYQKLLQSAKAQIEQYPDIAVAIILEPDSIGDLVASNDMSKCANSAQAHKRLLSLAVATLQLPNVSIYLDGANAGWLGSSESLAPTAALLAEILKDARTQSANATVRGLATNVSNYNGLGNQKKADQDELRYITDLAPYLKKVGFPANFIVDQGRSGNQNVTRGDDDWCNLKYAGFGIRPAVTTHPLVDAVVWVKPGGESDGTTDTSSSRYDTTCTSPTSYVPSPEAGDWSPDIFRLLLEQANPPL